MKRNRIVLLIFVLVVLSSCMPEFREPLGVQDTLLPDDDLIGVWYLVGSNFWNEYHFMAFFRMRDGILRIIYTDNISDAIEYQGYVVSLGQDYYINVRRLIHKEQGKKLLDFYYIFHYHINAGGELELWFFNEDFLKDAVRKGEIEGRIVIRDGSEDEVEIYASTKELRAFFLNHDKSEYLEEHPWPWRKMKM
jgi:hypothetical protein